MSCTLYNAFCVFRWGVLVAQELGLCEGLLEGLYWAVLLVQPGLSIAPLIWQTPVGV